MMASIDRKSCKIYSLGDETLGFIKRKLSSLYPEVFISLLFAFIIQCLSKDLTSIEALKLACNSVFEASLLSHSGLGSAKLIGPIWYLSSMILAMMFLYPLIRKYQDTMVKIGLPLLSVFILGFIMQNYNNFRTPGKWLFFMYKGFLRGIGELCLGALLYYVTKHLQDLNFTFLGKILLTLTKWTCWLSVIAYTATTTIKYDAFFLAVLSVAIIIAFSQQCIDSGIYDNKVVCFLGKFSLSLYLNHRYFSLYLGNLLQHQYSRTGLIIIYIFAAVSASSIVMVVSNFIRQHKSCLLGKIKHLIIEPDCV